METPRCTRCGQVQTVESRFCFRCGNRLFEGTPAEEPHPARTGPLPADPGGSEAPPSPPTHASPTQPERSDVVEVQVPDWMVQDWRAPLSLAVSATLFALIANYVLEIFIVIASVVGSDTVAWGDIAGQPLVLWSGFHGAIRGFSLSVTGFAWIAVAYLVGLNIARALVPQLFASAMDRSMVLTRAIKAGLLSVGLIIAISQIAAATLDPIDSSLFFFGDRSFFGSANIVGAIFIGFAAAAIAAGVALARAGGWTIGSLSGVHMERPAFLVPAWAGARRALLIGVVGMAVFFYVAQIIDLVSSPFGPEGRDVLALAIAFIPLVLFWGLLDVGGIWLLNAMRFFISEDVLFSGKPGWLYLSALIAGAAFILGGIAAARARRPGDGPAALQASVTPVVIIVPILFVGSWFWASSEGGEIVGAALLLPLVWAAVLAVGGFVWMNQAGIASGFSVTTKRAASAPPPPPPPPAPPSPPPQPLPASSGSLPSQPPPSSAPAPARAGFCSRCGAAVDADDRFCRRCGTAL